MHMCVRERHLGNLRTQNTLNNRESGMKPGNIHEVAPQTMKIHIVRPMHEPKNLELASTSMPHNQYLIYVVNKDLFI